MWHHIEVLRSTFALLEYCTTVSVQLQAAASVVLERTPMALNGDDGCEQSSLEDGELPTAVCQPCFVAVEVGAGGSDCVVPEFPVLDRLQLLRVSEVQNAIDPTDHMAKER